MYLSYINVQQNHSIPKELLKKNLKELYERTFSKMKLPYSFKTKGIEYTIDKVIVCSDNKGCNYKKDGLDGRKIIDKLVVYHDKNNKKLQNDHRSDSKYVTMFVSGSWKLKNGKQNKFDARFFPSLKNKITFGIAEESRGSFNPLVNTTQKTIDDILIPGSKSFFDKLIDDETQKLKAPTVTAIASQGGALFSKMSDVYPDRLQFEIANFHDFMDLLDVKVDTHYNSYEQKNSKQFKKVYFKPFDNTQYKTIGISNWGYVDIKGTKTCGEVQKVFNKFKKAIKEIEHNIVYNPNSVFKQQAPKGGMKQCPKGNPEASKTGGCPEGYVPRPNKSKKVCCYKKKMTKAEALRIKNAFAVANMKIPSELQKTLSEYLVKATVQKKKQPTSKKPVSKFNAKNLNAKQNGTFQYRGKKWNCMTLKKPELQALAESMGTGYLLKKTKKVLCEDIHRRLLYKKAT